MTDPERPHTVEKRAVAGPARVGVCHSYCRGNTTGVRCRTRHHRREHSGGWSGDGRRRDHERGDTPGDAVGRVAGRGDRQHDPQSRTGYQGGQDSRVGQRGDSPPRQEDDETGRSVSVVDRTVTPLRTVDSESEMGVFGWLILAGVAVLLAPLLRFIAVLEPVDSLRSDTGR